MTLTKGLGFSLKAIISSGALWLIFSMLLSLSLPVNAEIHYKKLVFASDPYCPYICEEKEGTATDQPGFLVEFARLALEPLGYRVEYELKPWKRVLAEARSGVIDGVITLSREDAEGLMLPEKPVLTTCQSVVTSRTSNYRWTGGQSLAGRSIALVAGYTYDGPVRDWLLANKDSRDIHHIHGEKALGEILGLIANERVDMTISDCNVASSTAKQMGYPDKFKYFPTGYRVEMYIGMYQHHSDAEIITQALDRALLEMRDDGRLFQLAEKYSIKNLH